MAVRLSSWGQAAFEAVPDEELPVGFRVVKLTKQFRVSDLHNGVLISRHPGTRQPPLGPARLDSRTDTAVGRARQMEEIVYPRLSKHMPVRRSRRAGGFAPNVPGPNPFRDFSDEVGFSSFSVKGPLAIYNRGKVR